MTQNKRLSRKLRSIHAALDDHLGDSDITHLDDNDEREQVPGQWAARELMGLIEDLETAPPKQAGAMAALDELRGGCWNRAIGNWFDSRYQVIRQFLYEECYEEVADSNNWGRADSDDEFRVSDWIRHDGGECPVHPMDMVQVRLGDCEYLKGKGQSIPWDDVKSYRPFLDEHGFRCCSSEGLLMEAKYIATNRDGYANQYESFPSKDGFDWLTPAIYRAPPNFANTISRWDQTLRRVCWE